MSLEKLFSNPQSIIDGFNNGSIKFDNFDTIRDARKLAINNPLFTKYFIDNCPVDIYSIKEELLCPIYNIETYEPYNDWNIRHILDPHMFPRLQQVIALAPKKWICSTHSDGYDNKKKQCHKCVYTIGRMIQKTWTFDIFLNLLYSAIKKAAILKNLAAIDLIIEYLKNFVDKESLPDFETERNAAKGENWEEFCHQYNNFIAKKRRQNDNDFFSKFCLDKKQMFDQTEINDLVLNPDSLGDKIFEKIQSNNNFGKIDYNVTKKNILFTL